MDPIADAGALVAERFPGALAAFLGGGVLSARRTATSDLDVVVVIGGPPAPFRESLRWRGWPVELFVHDQASIGYYFALDAAHRKPTLARMVADGAPVAGRENVQAAITDLARSVLAAGPPEPTTAELDWRRYGLTDLLDDLAGSTDPGETAVICWTVWRQTAELALLLAGCWLGGGKWLLRELRAADPELAAELVAASGDRARLTTVADLVLGRAGGRLWAGYRAEGQRG
jgi:hypothetical protein